MSSSTCRSCGAQIVWVKTSTGKKMPIDAETHEAGDTHFEYGRHSSHFQTCPNAAQHRKPKGPGYKTPDVITQTPVKSDYVREIPASEALRIDREISRGRDAAKTN